VKEPTMSSGEGIAKAEPVPMRTTPAAVKRRTDADRRLSIAALDTARSPRITHSQLQPRPPPHRMRDTVAPLLVVEFSGLLQPQNELWPRLPRLNQGRSGPSYDDFVTPHFNRMLADIKARLPLFVTEYLKN